MKRSIIVLMLLLLAGAIGAGWYANQITEAKDEATNTVNACLDAVKVGNVEVAMNLSRDKRFENEKIRLAAYEQLFKETPLQDAEIVELNREDSTQMTVTLNIKSEKTGTQTVTIPLLKEEGAEQWILLLDQMAIAKSEEE